MSTLPGTARRIATRRIAMWRVVGVAAALLALGASAACTGSGVQWKPTPSATGPGDGTGSPGPTPPGASSLAVVPAANARNVSPAAPVSATVTAGTLTTVSLTAVSDGKVIKGEFDTARTSWHNAQQLQYNRTYSLKVTGTGADGATYNQSRTFTTVRPNNLTMPYLRANDGTLLDHGTFGVGQPVVVWFDEPIKDKATAERSLSVTTEPAGLLGGWYWMNSHEVHWRPKDYWPAGTKVHVEAQVYGRNLGSGLYGQANQVADFTIGREKIAVADSKTHRMKVYIDGKQVTTINGHNVTAGIPISMGKGGTENTGHGIVDFTTNSGPHVVTLKYEVYHMTSASFGITDPHSHNYYAADIRKSIRISGDGEFVHLRDWDTWQIGKMNTSHGCINVGVEYIYWFYNNFGAGDIVDVTGTSRRLDVHNGLGDWVLSWNQWLKGSAVKS